MGQSFKFDDEKEPRLKKILIKIFLWAVQIAAVIFLAYFIVYYTVEKTNVIGISMESTLYDGESILIDKFSYRFAEPKRFDVIVFKKSGKEHSFYNTKRIIGLPGETIQIKEGNIYINGEIVEDIINTEQMANYGLAEDEIVLEVNEYFVLGDNRNNSEDSRYANIGNVTREEIIGKALLRISPFDLISKINLRENTSDNSESSEQK